MFRYPSNAKMVKELTKIAKEELEHFEQVNQWLEKTEYCFTPSYSTSLRCEIESSNSSQGTS